MESEEPKIKNSKHKAFADAYLFGRNTRNATRAYAYAYGKDLSDPTAYKTSSANGYKLLRNAEIKAYIEWHFEQRAIGRDEVLDMTKDILQFDPTEYIKDDMTLDLAKIKADGVGWMMEDIDMSEARNAHGQLERTIKARFIKKQPNINNLLKVLGAFERDNAQKAEHVHTIKGYAIISPDDWDSDETDQSI